MLFSLLEIARFPDQMMLFWPVLMSSHAFGCRTEDEGSGEGADGIYVEKGR